MSARTDLHVRRHPCTARLGYHSLFVSPGPLNRWLWGKGLECWDMSPQRPASSSCTVLGLNKGKHGLSCQSRQKPCLGFHLQVLLTSMIVRVCHNGKRHISPQGRSQRVFEEAKVMYILVTTKASIGNTFASCSGVFICRKVEGSACLHSKAESGIYLLQHCVQNLCSTLAKQVRELFSRKYFQSMKGMWRDLYALSCKVDKALVVIFKGFL